MVGVRSISFHSRLAEGTFEGHRDARSRSSLSVSLAAVYNTRKCDQERLAVRRVSSWKARK